MVKHIVMWNLKESAEGGDKQQNGGIMKKRLEALVGVIPGLLKLEVSFNFNPKGYDLVLYSEFESKEALEGYDIHPEHQAIRQFVQKIVEARAVADYEI